MSVGIVLGQTEQTHSCWHELSLPEVCSSTEQCMSFKLGKLKLVTMPYLCVFSITCPTYSVTSVLSLPTSGLMDPAVSISVIPWQTLECAMQQHLGISGHLYPTIYNTWRKESWVGIHKMWPNCRSDIGSGVPDPVGHYSRPVTCYQKAWGSMGSSRQLVATTWDTPH